MKRNVNRRMSSLLERYSPEEYHEMTKDSDVKPDHHEHHDEKDDVDVTIGELQDAAPDDSAVAAIAETQEIEPLPQENANDLIDDDNGDSIVISDSTDDTVESDDEDMPEAEIMEAESDADIAEADAVEDEIADIEETQAALEAYAELIRSAGLDGISQQAAAFMAVGLKSAVKHAPSLEAIQVSCEAYETGPRGAVTKANVSLETISESIKEAFRKLIEWLKKRITAGRHFFKRFTTNLMAVSSELKKMEEELRSYKGRPMNEWETTVSEILFTGDRFSGYDIEQLIKPSKQVTEDYPRLINSLIDKLTQKIKSFDPEKDNASDLVDEISGVLNKDSKEEKIELPGGRTIVHFPGYGVKLEEDENFSSPDTRITATRYPVELKKAAKDARACLNILLKSNTINDKLSNSYDSLISSIEELIKKAEKSGDDSTKESSGKLRELLNGPIREISPDNDKVVAYLGKCLVARISFLRKAIKAGNDKVDKK